MNARRRRSQRLGKALAITATVSLVTGGSLVVGGLLWQQAASAQVAEQSAQLDDANQALQEARDAMGEALVDKRDAKATLKDARNQALRTLDAAGEMGDSATLIVEAHRDMIKLQSRSDRAFLHGDLDESNSYWVPFDLLVEAANAAQDTMWELSAKVLPIRAGQQIDT